MSNDSTIQIIMAQTEWDKMRNRRLVLAAEMLERQGKQVISTDIRSVLAENSARAARLAAVEQALHDLLALEWQPERTMAGTDNLFCPFCGGCPGSASSNLRTQRSDGHMIGTFIRHGRTIADGCPAARLFDQARATGAVGAGEARDG